MTTNAQLLDQAMSRLGQRTSTRVRADVLTEINQTINTLERGTFIPWFLEETATLAVVSGESYKDLPSDFAIEADESRPYWIDADGETHFLTKRFYGALPGESAATSLKYYAIRGSEFHFRMVADGAYTIYVPYYARQTGDFDDNGEVVSNKWLIEATEWVLGDALQRVAAFHLHNGELATMHNLAAQRAQRELFNFHEARVNKNQDFEVGGASDGS